MCTCIEERVRKLDENLNFAPLRAVPKTKGSATGKRVNGLGFGFRDLKPREQTGGQKSAPHYSRKQKASLSLWGALFQERNPDSKVSQTPRTLLNAKSHLMLLGSLRSYQQSCQQPPQRSERSVWRDEFSTAHSMLSHLISRVDTTSMSRPLNQTVNPRARKDAPRASATPIPRPLCLFCHRGNKASLRFAHYNLCGKLGIAHERKLRSKCCG